MVMNALPEVANSFKFWETTGKISYTVLVTHQLNRVISCITCQGLRTWN